MNAFALEIFTPAGLESPADLVGEFWTPDRYPSIDAAKEAGRGVLSRRPYARGFAVSTVGTGDSLRLEWTETRHGATFDASTLSPLPSKRSRDSRRVV